MVPELPRRSANSAADDCNTTRMESTGWESVQGVKLPLDFDWQGGNTRCPFLLVDVFTDTPLEGNPLGVFTDARRYSSAQMQRLARELNLSETVFVLPAEREADVRIRIFTPRGELSFAGHPVLGCAFVVGEALGGEVVRLETGLGVIPIELERERGGIVFGRM